MASLSRSLLLQSRRCAAAIPRRPAPAPARLAWHRPLSSTPQRRAEDAKEGSATAAAAKAPAKVIADATTAEVPEDDTAAQLRRLVADLSAMDPEVVDDAIRKGRQGIPFAQDYELEKDEDFELVEDDMRRTKTGFWAEGEMSMGPDEDYFGDDITSHGHGQLQQHRELREYARLIAWELPLLSQLARPFEPPTSATPFRFRYTSYLGESHPASNKVVVEFSASDLSLTPVQRNKLIKLSGPRYNPSTDIIKMSCENYDTQAQNKRFLGERIHALVAEAKDSADTFEDVPFDFRHHKPKPRYEFPKEWVLTAERKAQLAAKRQEAAELQDQRLHNGQLVDGRMVIETSLPFLEQQAEPVLVDAPRGKGR